MLTLGIDPGMNGGFAIVNEKSEVISFFIMPLTGETKLYDKKEVDRPCLVKQLKSLLSWDLRVYCELPVSYGMLPASAFWYGFNFAILRDIVEDIFGSVTYVSPHIWTKVLHSGLDKDLKAKAKSLIAFSKMWPDFSFGKMTKASKEGIIDATLIAEFGRRYLMLNAPI